MASLPINGVALCSKMRYIRRMTGKISSATERALKLVAKGWTAYAAAKKTGIALSTIYRAQKRLATPKPKE